MRRRGSHASPLVCRGEARAGSRPNLASAVVGKALAAAEVAVWVVLAVSGAVATASTVQQIEHGACHERVAGFSGRAASEGNAVVCASSVSRSFYGR